MCSYIMCMKKPAQGGLRVSVFDQPTLSWEEEHRLAFIISLDPNISVSVDMSHTVDLAFSEKLNVSDTFSLHQDLLISSFG